jgi:hypothetical protein
MWLANEIDSTETNESRFPKFQLRSGMLALMAAAVFAVGTPDSKAGDREWATAGKVLTGVVAGSLLLRALEPSHCRTVTTTYYETPPTVVYQQPVMVQSAPVVVQQAPVFVQSAPVVYVQPAPIYVRPAPVVYYRTVTYGPVHPRPFFHRHHGW